MSRRLYPGWNLRHLKTHILPRTVPIPELLYPTDSNVDLCMRTLAVALPALKTIDGQRRSSLLRQEPHARQWNVSAYDN